MSDISEYLDNEHEVWNYSHLPRMSLSTFISKVFHNRIQPLYPYSNLSEYDVAVLWSSPDRESNEARPIAIGFSRAEGIYYVRIEWEGVLFSTRLMLT